MFALPFDLTQTLLFYATTQILWLYHGMSFSFFLQFLCSFTSCVIFRFIKLRASSSLSTDFLCLIWFQRYIPLKGANKCWIPKLNFLIFHPILMQFFVVAILLSLVWVIDGRKKQFCYFVWKIGLKGGKSLIFCIFGRHYNWKSKTRQISKLQWVQQITFSSIFLSPVHYSRAVVVLIVW